MPWKHGFGIGLIGSTLEKPRLLLASIYPKTYTPDTPGHTSTDASECKPQIVFSFTIKTTIDYAFAQRPVFYCCSNNGQQTITVGAG